MSKPPATVTTAPSNEAYAGWQRAVAGVLARGGNEPGEQPERALAGTTLDGVSIAALYTGRDELPEQPLPGSAPFVRGRVAGQDLTRGWHVCVREGDGSSAAAANAAVLAALLYGGSALWLPLGGDAPEPGRLAEVLQGVRLDLAPVVLDAGAGTEAAAAELAVLLDALPEPARTGVDVCLGADPYRRAFGRGDGPDQVAAVQLALAAATRAGSVRALVVDGTISHDAGAGDADEVGTAIATGVAHLRALLAAGMDTTTALGQVDFRFAVTDDQFLAIAKLRAARRLWARVAEVLGEPAAGGMRTHAVTSAAMLAQRDPWVNLLRTTVAAFGAGVGGADLVTVLPFDAAIPGGMPGVSPGRGKRLARNIALLLLEESHVGRVRDPAGGSWYVETLTAGLGAAAWAWFQQIEAAGGLDAALSTGMLADRFAATRERRAADLAHRRRAMTGVNEFPDLTERPLPVTESAMKPADGFGPYRYSAPFEALRDRSDAHLAATGRRPRVLLVTLGPVAEHNVRATYAANLLASGGIESVRPGPIPDPAAAVAAQQEAGCGVVVLCGDDEAYARSGAAVVSALREAGASLLLAVGSADAVPAGVSARLSDGIDTVAVLTDLLDRVGAR
ncbi:MAG TPA: methylmalonyl-CoA mutase family protein [Candidatus Nanopelagicales bacterium]|nr:methylmalonyl-CoA mutase family protein [Candidatus Nanopelagicales bacterium]